MVRLDGFSRSIEDKILLYIFDNLLLTTKVILLGTPKFLILNLRADLVFFTS